jgi:hypothetical protein
VQLFNLARKSGREYKTSDRIPWWTYQRHTQFGTYLTMYHTVAIRTMGI